MITHTDHGMVHCSVCREQWIRAKYDRKEFLSDKTDESIPYMTGELGGAVVQ